MKNGKSLATKFTITLLIILFIGQSLGLVLFILSIRNSLVASLNEKMERTGSLLARISVGPISSDDAVLLNTYLEEIFKDEDFVSLAVFDRNKNLLEGKKRFTQESSKINPFYVHPFFENETPVFLGHEKIGNIVITSSAKNINDEIFRRMVFAIIYQGILLIGIVLLVSTFFNRNIRRPMSDLSIAVSKVGTGDLTVMMQPAAGLELAILTKGFNSLTARLRDTMQKLHSTISNVTMAIKQINLVIGKVTEGTNKQVSSTEEVILALEDTDQSQRKILDNTQKLAKFSEENLASLFEIKSNAKEITENTEQLFQSSSDAYSTIAEMSASAKTIAQSTEDLSTSTEETSASVEQIGANLKEVESSTKESARLATEVREIASDRGMLSLTDAMDGMERIEEAVNESLKLVRNLGVKSKDIEKILLVITDVTKQTNLLSVNAAVLAAQAGEYGKGFSVVADEIKILAGKTAASAREIKNIIKSIQKVIAETTRVTESSKLVVEKGQELVIKIGSAFGSILEGSQKSSEMTKTIQRATKEQVRGITQIAEAMGMIGQIVAQVSKATHEQETGSEHLLGVSEKVKEVSDLIKRSMQEQNVGISMISKNLEFTNERIKQIADGTSEQGKTNEDILSAAERIRLICHNTLVIAQEMVVSFNSLYQESEALRRDMEGFKLE